MTKEEMQNKVAKVLCGKEESITCDYCYENFRNEICKNSKQCRISEKSKNQLEYVLSPLNKNIYLEACPGSGKTEVVGMKAAYEFNLLTKNSNSGIAVLTFTNEATNVIKDRVGEFGNQTTTYPNYIGTLSSFIHKYIAQPFGYKVKGYESTSRDASFRIIDSDLNINLNPWLKKYKCSVTYFTETNTILPVCANQISYDHREKDYFIKQYNNYIYFKEYYHSIPFQNWVKKIREEQNEHWKYKYNYCKSLLDGDKEKFFKAGYANFNDMNNIAFEVLSSSGELAERLSKKFTNIIIDECQDLSWIELQILSILKEKGTNLHFIGDINQSIFEFKKNDPKDIIQFTQDFEKIELNDNFRSCQPIVNFSNILIGLNKDIKGCEINKLNEYSLMYLEYNKKPEELLHKYNQILEKFKINKSKSVIIVKQNTLKEQLEKTTSRNEKHLLLNGIQLWNNGNTQQKQKALIYAGKQISKWFGGGKTKDSYFCPIKITSVFRWRLFLKDILNDCNENHKLTNYNRIEREWYKDARAEIPNIIKRRYNNLKQYDEIKNRNFDEIFKGSSWLKAVNADAPIIIRKEDYLNNNFKVMTIHGSKGCTFDSTLVISSSTKKSQDGYWKDWLCGDEEGKRLGYVASTRAKYLLIWGVPKLSQDDEEIIKKLGFIDGNKVITD